MMGGNDLVTGEGAELLRVSVTFCIASSFVFPIFNYNPMSCLAHSSAYTMEVTRHLCA